ARGHRIPIAGHDRDHASARAPWTAERIALPRPAHPHLALRHHRPARRPPGRGRRRRAHRRGPADQPRRPLRAALPRLRRRLGGPGVGPRPPAPARRARAPSPRRAAAGRRSDPGRRGVDRPAAGLARRRRRRPVAVLVHGQAGHARAVAGVPHAAVGLPPQGGRPAHLRHPPALRPDEGRDGGDPGRRVRRRLRRPDAQRALRRAAGRPRPRRRLRGAVGRRPGPGVRLGQHDVPLRPAPALARRGPGPPDGGRDDVVGAQPALLGRTAPAGLRRAGDRLLRRARGGRRRARADRLGGHVRLARRRRAAPGRRRAVRRRLLAGDGRPGRHPPAGGLGGRPLGAARGASARRL
ncbi:MAG: FIG01125890: hypothetical protein, partial [uncultured Blastococcus sp.]